MVYTWLVTWRGTVNCWKRKDWKLFCCVSHDHHMTESFPMASPRDWNLGGGLFQMIRAWTLLPTPTRSDLWRSVERVQAQALMMLGVTRHQIVASRVFVCMFFRKHFIILNPPSEPNVVIYICNPTLSTQEAETEESRSSSKEFQVCLSYTEQDPDPRNWTSSPLSNENLLDACLHRTCIYAPTDKMEFMVVNFTSNRSVACV